MPKTITIDPIINGNQPSMPIQPIIAGPAPKLAAFAVVWGIGALVGSISGGWSMTIFGPHGLPLHLTLVYGLLVVGLAVRGAFLVRSNRARSNRD